MDLLPAIEKFDLEGWCSDQGGDQLQDHEWALVCPNCFKTKLIVNTQKKSWHCWVCQKYDFMLTARGMKRIALSGAGGLVDLIQLVEGVSRIEAARVILRGDLTDPALQIPEVHLFDAKEQTGITTAPKIAYPEAIHPIQLGDPAQRYLQGRGIGYGTISAYGLSWCISGRYARRVVFPVYEGGVFVYFQARAIADDVLIHGRYVKVLNPSSRSGGVVSSEVLFNLDNAQHFPRVAICEGPIDAIKVGPSAVCTFGKAISATQIAKLVYAGVRAVDLVWDSDAKDAMLDAAKLLQPFFDVRIVALPHGDPGDFTREQNAWYREHSIFQMSDDLKA